MTILDEIIAYKRTEVAKQKVAMRMDQLEKFGFFNEKPRSLKASIAAKQSAAIIAEFKRKSPSKGIINGDANVFNVTAAYAENGAAGISVLTDSNFFGGSTDDLIKARVTVANVPILRKDFLIDEYQVIEAKAIGADVILLIAACLRPDEVRTLATLARSLGMESLLEIHDEEELDHICDEVDLVGVNNRNLKTFKVDLEQSVKLAQKIGNGKLKIAESGINSKDDIQYLQQQGFDGFLIGERFMKEPEPGGAFANFMRTLNDKL